MLVVTVAAMAAMTLALVIAGSRFTFGCGSGGFIRPLVAAAIMTRTALIRTSARPPDFDQDRFCRNRRLSRSLIGTSLASRRFNSRSPVRGRDGDLVMTAR